MLSKFAPMLPKAIAIGESNMGVEGVDQKQSSCPLQLPPCIRSAALSYHPDAPDTSQIIQLNPDGGN
jgi:hypothetical protein